MIKRYRSLSDLPAILPVFPLSGAILLPRANLPLTVFEPRYLSLVEDVMSGDRLLGIIQPRPRSGDDTAESPLGKEVPLHTIGCVGRITSYQELEDSRLLISVTGVARFRSTGEDDTELPYRRLKVSYETFGHDLTEGIGEEQVDRERLLSVLKAYLSVNKLAADWDSIKRASTEQLINALSIMSPFGVEEKQALLEAQSLQARADVLIALTEMELASGIGGAGTLQ
jgi:uncharacterized protein